MTTAQNVIVYSKPTCQYCDMAKDFLKENHIQFENIDVSKDKIKAKEMIEKSGQMSIPVIEIGDTIIIGFNKEAIKTALGLK
jgi:glutaredoxin 3